MITKDELTSRIGQRLADLRAAKGVTQEKLAFDAKLNRAYIGYIERGERNPSIYTMAKIARALKVDLHELFILR